MQFQSAGAAALLGARRGSQLLQRDWLPDGQVGGGAEVERRVAPRAIPRGGQSSGGGLDRAPMRCGQAAEFAAEFDAFGARDRRRIGKGAIAAVRRRDFDFAAQVGASIVGEWL